MGMTLEEAKVRILTGLDELESDIAILTERIKTVREGVSHIEDMEELKRFTTEAELEDDLKHIELF